MHVARLFVSIFVNLLSSILAELLRSLFLSGDVLFTLAGARPCLQLVFQYSSRIVGFSLVEWSLLLHSTRQTFELSFGKAN